MKPKKELKWLMVLGKTDAWIIEKGGVYAVNADTITELENFHAQQKGLPPIPQPKSDQEKT